VSWSQKAGDAIVDLGSPLGVIEAGGDAGDPIGGFSILRAERRDAVQRALDGHPHAAMRGTIQTLECLPMPGM
jgi:hypothetical protein